MAEVDISSVSVVVVGGSTSQEVDLNIGPQGTRGTRTWGVTADPRLATTTKPAGVALYDIAIVVTDTETDYRVMYQKTGNGAEDWIELIDLNLSAAASDVEGIPAAGTSGQVLAKASNTDYDVEWVTPSTSSSTYGDTDVASYLDGTYLNGNIDSHMIPSTHATYDLGTAEYKWRYLYTTDIHMSNEGIGNDVDGTWGNYTIQEGETDLFLINHRNGKKYKFNLTEVS